MASIGILPALSLGGSGTTTTPTTTTGGQQPSTAAGLLALLSESDSTLQMAALHRLLSCVDTLWHEVAEQLSTLESLSEDDELPNETRKTAAAVASRVFFHLEEPAQALRLALDAGDEYVESLVLGEKKRSVYVESLIAAAIEAYIRQTRKGKHGKGGSTGAVDDGGDDDDVEMEDEDATDDLGKSSSGGGEVEIDPMKLQRVLSILFERCYRDGEYHHALGVALEAREVDKFETILSRCASDASSEILLQTLHYALYACINLVTSKAFRIEALTLVANHLGRMTMSKTDDSGKKNKKKDWAGLCQCYQLLNRPGDVASTITTLLDDDDDDDEDGDGEERALLGYQLCFDLVDSGDEAFVDAVATALPKKPSSSSSTTTTATATGDESTTTTETTGTGTGVSSSDGKVRTEKQWDHFVKAERVLVGGFHGELSLSFLHKNSDSDRLIMEQLKRRLEEKGGGRNSVLHNCAVVTHAYLNAGTTNDSFLRDHLDWMRKASNWAKFSATATLGVIHAGHTSEAMTLLEPYLPAQQENANVDPAVAAAAAADGGGAGAAGGGGGVSTTGGYTEGGSLFALGLIHGSNAGCASSKRREACRYLRGHLRTSHANEVISHGAALAVGLTAMGTADLEVANELKELLYTDSAVAGEAAGIATGLVLVGQGFQSTNVEMQEIIAELKNYGRETQHEKIIRGIAMGMALISYRQEENADATITEMRGDRDPILRYGAQYAIALAYIGTGSNKAIRILLHTAVSDVSDDVRMAAVIALAFVLYRTPERVPQLVKLLLESFNPHVRYASCMAVGIAMAGSGDADSVTLLEPMLEDMTDFVRQGALLGTAMIYMQQSDTCNGRKIKSFREKISNMVGDKHQSTLTKMGAVLGTGLLDAGGRNCSIDLGSRNGFTKTTSAVGLVLWLQHWHWYPMMHMISLALTPTFTIGLNKDFKYPKGFEIQCNSKPSAFAYPKKLEEKKEEKKKRVETVTLSTTAKNKARLARKKAKEEKESGGGAADMDVVEEKKDDEGGAIKAEDKKGDEMMDVDGGGTAVDEEKKEGDGGEGDEEEEKVPPKKKKREPEPTSFRIKNPSRVTKAQADVCLFDPGQRYRPVRAEGKPFGVIMLTDSTPDEEDVELGTVKTPFLEDEAEPPEPFEWAPPGHPDYVDPTPAAADAAKEEGEAAAADDTAKEE